MDVRSIALGIALLAAVIAVVASLATTRGARRASAAEALLERRLDLALDAGGMTTWLWDADGDVVSWDGRARHLYGDHPPATWQAWLATMHADDVEAVRAALQQSLDDRAPFHAVHRYQHADGSLRWLELRGEPVLDDSGGLLGSAGVVVDVTADREASSELAESRAALEQLLDLTPAFVDEERPEAVPARICDAGVAVFAADACSIWAADADTLHPVVSCPRDLLERLGPPIPLREVPLLWAQLAKRLPVNVTVGRGDDPRAEALIDAAGMRSGVIVPLAQHGGRSLFLALLWLDEVQPGLAQQAVMRRFADQVALALAQARARAANAEVAELNETLQASLLPVPLVRDPAFEVAVRYRPSEQRILLGGDFYDVVERPDGAIGFVVGDVTGHGPTPAAVGAALRSGWRALVLSDDDPGRWLHGLATSFASYQMGPELLVTVVTGLVSPDRRSMVVANAGHPAPILLTEQTAAPLDVPHGIAIGLDEPGSGVETTHVRLASGWRLLLYTDGVVEVRTGRRSYDFVGIDGLTVWLREHAPGTGDEPLLDALLAHLDEVAAGPLADDVAVVLLGSR